MNKKNNTNIKAKVANSPDPLANLMDVAMNRGRNIQRITMDKQRGENWIIILEDNQGSRTQLDGRHHRDVINRAIRNITKR